MKLALVIIASILLLDLLDWLIELDARLSAVEGGAKILKGPWPDRENDNAG